jgi:hypothetical protein
MEDNMDLGVRLMIGLRFESDIPIHAIERLRGVVPMVIKRLSLDPADLKGFSIEIDGLDPILEIVRRHVGGTVDIYNR